MTTEDIQNIFASDVEGNIIHINNAKSGRKGYFCLGCEKEMQAVKPIVRGIKSYFRHDVEANKSKGKCTYSDETYRHKLAKEALQISKRIKVPTLLKYHPTNQGDALLIKQPHYIEAHSVSIELSFYETDDGEVRWGKDIGEGQHLLIRPDVTFFNANGEPILLIEIVATHKLTEDKIILMRRLGIDTVSVTIPKDSPEAIKEVFEETSRTKWIYNYEQETTQYISLSNSDAEAVPSIDEQQKRDFKITLKCRQAEIGDLIRRIGRCLASEQFRAIDEANRRELQRVEENTEQLLRDIDGKAERNTTSLSTEEELEIAEYRETARRNREIISEIGIKQYKVERRHRVLEERYHRKSEHLRREQEEINTELRKLGYRRTNFELDADRRRVTFEGKRTNIDRQISEVERRITAESERLQEIARQTTLLPEDFERNKEHEQSGYSGRKERLADEVRADESYRETLRTKYENIEAGARKEFDDRRSELFKTDNREAFDKVPEFARGIEDFNNCLRQADIVINNQLNIDRFKAIKEFLTTGTFKIWLPKS